MDIEHDYATLESRIVEWAEREPAVWGILVVGSRALPGARQDTWADLDLIIFVSDPADYAASPDWLAKFGELWLAVPKRTGRGDPEWRTLYAGGAKVDFVLAQAQLLPGEDFDLWMSLAASGYEYVTQRAVRVLLDKGRLAAPTESAGAQTITAGPITPAEFRSDVDATWLVAATAARLLVRGDLWRAARQLHCVLKQHLLTMLEWHTQVSQGGAVDTWYDGRYLSDWADPRALLELPATFGAFERAALGQALLATIDLYWWLARETAARLPAPFPTPTDERVVAWLRSIVPWAGDGPGHATP